MNGILQYIVLEGTEVLVRTTNYRVSEELIRASVHGHAFGTLHICQDNREIGRAHV